MSQQYRRATSPRRSAQLVQTARGDAADTSGCTGSTCFECLRDRFWEPYTMTRTIATTPHSSRRSHAWFAESAPENIWPTNPLENVLFMAWNSMTINTLPLALLNNHVYTIDHSMGNNRARRDEPRPSDHRPDSWCGHSSEVGRPYPTSIAARFASRRRWEDQLPPSRDRRYRPPLTGGAQSTESC